MIKGGKAEKKFEEKIKILTSECHKILDIGTSQRFAKELRAYESLFDKCDYTAAGYEPEMKFGKYNCNCHADIDNMHFCDESFDAIICIEVLEHVANPFNAVENIFKVLKKGGRLLLTTPFMLGYHGKTRDLNVYKTHAHSAYPDFWRFTHEGLSYLLKDFSEVDIDVLVYSLSI